MSFAGQRVLVTGASKGIGAACARAFASAGAAVVIHTRADMAAAEALCGELGGGCTVAKADLSIWEAGERLVAEAERSGPLDHVVLNHGIWKESAIDAMTRDSYDETMDANVRGCFSVAGAAVRRMKTRKRGSIVLIASTAGQRGEALHSHYAASKGAIISLTKSLASELAPFGIRANCVAPGWVRTPMSEGALLDPKTRDDVLRVIPLGRVGEPSEIAEAVLYMCGAAFVTGEILNVNGGAVLIG